MLTFLTAGHETSSGTLIWATYILATHPDVQDKLRSEVMQIVDSSNQGLGITWDKIDRLCYLNNFVKEVLRLFCPR
jgi:cytochrome P450